MSRIDEIKAYAQRRDENEAKKVVAENEKKAQLEEQIRSLEPRIKELVETANACLTNGIEINAYGSRFDHYYDNRERGTFVTNGISHRIGFVARKGAAIFEMGIDAGGACGEWYFRTNGKDIYEIKEDHTESRQASAYWMSRFVNEFDEFEADFYSYIDSITRRK